MGITRKGIFDTPVKMNLTTWLCAAIAAIAFATPAASSEPRVVCYYTNWSVYRPGTARFNPQNINPYLCTHLVYAFGGFTKDNTLKPFDKYQDIEKGGYAKFNGLKTYNKNLKTLLAIGGWNEGSARFSPLVASRDRRKEFVRNVIKFLRQNNFDGLDLDWEYPAFRDGGKPKDRENYSKLVKELREEFEREAEKTGKSRLLLTMAVPAGIEYIQKGFDVQTLNRYLDWMNLLSYDYHSAFEPSVNHHAPLYPLEEPNEYSVDNELNIDYTIKFYLENGADRDKLVLGIPTYGRSYTLFNPDAVAIGSPADGPGEQGDATREKGYLAYYEICEALKPKNKKRSTDDEDAEDSEDSEEEQEPEWEVMHPNPKAMGPVAFRGNQWVGYDDMDIVKKKAEYVVENGLGGIMFWSIDNDDFRGNCHGKPYPLIEAAKEAYIGKLGATDNSVERATPSPVRRRNRPKTTASTTTTEKPSTASRPRSTKRPNAVSTTTPTPPTTPDPGADFKCVDEGFYPHPRDCKKYFWCLDSGPSNLGIVAHQFTCPSGLFFNKAADSCDFARNVLCKKTAATTKAPTTRAPTTTTTTEEPTTTTTTRRPLRLSTRNSLLFRTTTTTTTPEPELEEEEIDEDVPEDSVDIDAEDPKVIKELIDLIKKVGGVEQLEKHLRLGETSSSTDGVITTTPSAFNKKLYQKVLERTRGKSKFTGKSITDGTSQNSRRGPQNAGLEPSADKDRLLRKDRPQYTTINRSRPFSASTTEEPLVDEDSEDEAEEQPQVLSRGRAVETDIYVATSARPLQYVNIRRARPTLTTSDTADDTASRNALFERVEPVVTAVSEASSSVDLLNSRRENVPEYVTIRRQRPTTEETTTAQYEIPETESQDTALEREISSQPQYTSIVRARATTVPTVEEPSSPEPTTVLAVQISSFLNSPSEEGSVEQQATETAESEATDAVATSTASSTTTSSTTAAPSSAAPRRPIIRRRGSTSTTTTSAPVSSTQVSPKNYTFVRRRRPLSRPNDITPDLDEADENSRKIRSTTPDSREIEGVRNQENQSRGTRFRFSSQNEDSVPAAASPVERGSFRPKLTRDEVLSLTPIDFEAPQFIPRERTIKYERRFRGRPSTTVSDNIEKDSNLSPDSEPPVTVSRENSIRNERRFRGRTSTTAPDNVEDNETSPDPDIPVFLPRETVIRNERRFKGRTSTTVAGKVEDSEASAATVEVRRPNLLPRGRSRFSLSTPVTSEPSVTESTISVRRPAFVRFSPRPFERPSSTASEDSFAEEQQVTPKAAPRVPFVRARSSFSTNAVQGRKLPFPSRSTTEQSLSNDEDEELDNKNDDIALSETAIEEKEHEDNNVKENEDVEKNEDVEIPKRRIVIKKLRAPSSTTSDLLTTETLPTDGTGRKKFIIRRRPTSTTEAAVSVSSTEASTSAGQKVRRIVRKKLKPVQNSDTSNIETSSESSIKDSVTTEAIVNYGEKTRKTVVSSTVETTTTLALEEVEIKKEEISEVSREQVLQTEVQENNKKDDEKPVDQQSEKEPKNDEHRNEVQPTEPNLSEQNNEVPEEGVPEVILQTDQKSLDISEQKERESLVTETAEPEIEIITTTTTQATSPSTRGRLPYRPSKRLFTSTTESSVSSSSRTFSRKFNPGAYTSPATGDKSSFRPTTRRPLFTTKQFSRRPFTPSSTTKKVEDEDDQYDDDEILEEEPESPIVLVPQNQFYSRKPEGSNRDETEDDLESGELNEEEESEDQNPPNRFTTSRKPIFKPRVVNSNTFRASTSTTELPKRQFSAQNRTAIFNRFGGNKLANDTKKRVQNVPIGYSGQTTKSTSQQSIDDSTTTITSNTADEQTTTDSDFITLADDDDYLTMTESTDVTDTTQDSTKMFNDITSSYTIETETSTAEMEVDTSTDDYLEFTESTTNYPSTFDSTLNTQTETESIKIKDKTTASLPETTTNLPTVSPVVKTQFDKLFSISRVVEVSSKLDKHRINKNNETTLIEEGKIMVEKKPMVDKIGEVSRFSLIKIVEDEIPLYLTKLGHVYPVENPPENLIRIDEGRNARALVNFADGPRENLVASESINELYRHVKNSNNDQDITNKGKVEHLPNDDFLTFINVDKKTDRPDVTVPDSYTPEWQFVPAAFENERNNQLKTAKSYEIVTPRSLRTDQSTLPLEALFKTENPVMARKINDNKGSQPFVVYSSSVPNQKDEVNLVKLQIISPEAGRSIITFAKGQEFNGAPVDERMKYSDDMSVIPLSIESETVAPTEATTIITTENIPTSPLIELLTTTSLPVTEITEAPTTTSTDASTTETVPEETTTQKISPVDAKKSKFAFPRRPIIKTSNFTRPVPRVAKKINATVINTLSQKQNKTTGFNPSKSRFSASRSQNVPVDIRKSNTRLPLRPSSTEAPRTTTERKISFKPIRPNFRPAFVPRRSTAAPQTTVDT